MLVYKSKNPIPGRRAGGLPNRRTGLWPGRPYGLLSIKAQWHYSRTVKKIAAETWRQARYNNIRPRKQQPQCAASSRARSFQSRLLELSPDEPASGNALIPTHTAKQKTKDGRLAPKMIKPGHLCVLDGRNEERAGVRWSMGLHSIPPFEQPQGRAEVL